MRWPRFYRLLGSDEMDVEANRAAWERSKAIFDATFALIQAGIVLGVLQTAASKLNDGSVIVLWLLCYAVIGVFIIAGSNYLTALLFDYYGWSGAKYAKAIFRALTAAVAFIVPYFISAITSDALVNLLR